MHGWWMKWRVRVWVDVFVQSGWQHSVQSRLPSSTLPPDFLVLSLNTSTMAEVTQDQDTISLPSPGPGFVSGLRCHNQQDNWAQPEPSPSLHSLYLYLSDSLCRSHSTGFRSSCWGRKRWDPPLCLYKVAIFLFPPHPPPEMTDKPFPIRATASGRCRQLMAVYFGLLHVLPAFKSLFPPPSFPSSSVGGSPTVIRNLQTRVQIDLQGCCCKIFAHCAPRPRLAAAHAAYLWI